MNVFDRCSVDDRQKGIKRCAFSTLATGIYHRRLTTPKLPRRPRKQKKPLMPFRPLSALQRSKTFIVFI